MQDLESKKRAKSSRATAKTSKSGKGKKQEGADVFNCQRVKDEQIYLKHIPVDEAAQKRYLESRKLD